MGSENKIQGGFAVRKSMVTFFIALLSAFLLNTAGVIEQMAPSEKKSMLNYVASPVHGLSEQMGLTYPRAQLKSEFKSIQDQPFWWMTPAANAQDIASSKGSAHSQASAVDRQATNTEVRVNAKVHRNTSNTAGSVNNGQAAALPPKPKDITKPTRTPVTAQPVANTTPSETEGKLTTAPDPKEDNLAEDGANILIVGDSLMGGVGPQLKRLLRKEHQQSNSTLKWKSSTGLTRVDYFNWPETLTQLFDKRSYNLVVAIFGTNDNQSVKYQKKILRYGTPDWFSFYRDRVDEVLTIMCRDQDTRLIWVGLPKMRSKAFDRKIVKMNQIFQEEVKKSTCGKYIPMSKYIAPEDSYTSYLKLNGKKTKVRASDGIHMTYLGNHYVAKSLAADIITELTPRPLP